MEVGHILKKQMHQKRTKKVLLGLTKRECTCVWFVQEATLREVVEGEEQKQGPREECEGSPACPKDVAA